MNRKLIGLALLGWLACGSAWAACGTPGANYTTYDGNGGTCTAPTPVIPSHSGVNETSHVVAGSGPATLHGAAVTTGAVPGYFMVLNASADPGNGALSPTPVKCVVAAANNTTSVSPDTGTSWTFATGIVLVFSTTGCLTETQSPTAYFSWQ